LHDLTVKYTNLHKDLEATQPEGPDSKDAYVAHKAKRQELYDQETKTEEELSQQLMPMAVEAFKIYVRYRIEEAQKQLRSTYGSTVTLYRGVTDALPGTSKFIDKALKVKKPTMKDARGIGALVSYSDSEEIARYFSGIDNSWRGIIYQVKVPVKNIVASYVTNKNINHKDYVSHKHEKTFLAITTGNEQVKVVDRRDESVVANEGKEHGDFKKESNCNNSTGIDSNQLISTQNNIGGI
jgi:hypothetical protein